MILVKGTFLFPSLLCDAKSRGCNLSLTPVHYPVPEPGSELQEEILWIRQRNSSSLKKWVVVHNPIQSQIMAEKEGGEAASSDGTLLFSICMKVAMVLVMNK